MTPRWGALLAGRARRRYIAISVMALVAIAAVGAWRGVWPDWNAVVASIVVVLIALPAWVRDTAEPPPSPGKPGLSDQGPAGSSSATAEALERPAARPLQLEPSDTAAVAHALAGSIWRRRDIERIAGQAGVPRSYVDFEGNAQVMWEEVLDKAQARSSEAFSKVIALAVDQAPSLRNMEAVTFWKTRLPPDDGRLGR